MAKILIGRTLDSSTDSVTIDDGGGSVTVDGTVTTTPSGTQDINIVGDAAGISTSAAQTDGSQKTQIVDGAGDGFGTPTNPLVVSSSSAGPSPRDAANSTKIPLSPGAFTAFTVDDATDVFTSAGHGLSDGDPVVLTTDDTLPAGLVEDLVYYVSDATANTFKLKNGETAFATYLDVTDTGTGTHSWAVPGEFLGPWTELTTHTDLLMFGLTNVPLGSFEVIWSEDGVVPRSGVLAVSNIKATEDTTNPGFAIYLDTLTTDVGPYYRVRLRSGSSVASLCEVDTWVYPGGFHGTFQSLTDQLSNLSTALLTRSVISGFQLDENLEISSAFANAQITPSGALRSADTPDTLAEDSFQLSGALPSGATPAFDPVGPIVAANVRDTGWINASEWDSGQFRAIFDVAGVKVFLLDASDTLGNNSITTSFDFPTATSAGLGTSINIGAAIFQDYFRVIVINDSGSDSNAWGYRSLGLHHAMSPLTLSLDQPIFDFFPAPLTQSIPKARQPDGDYVEGRADGGAWEAPNIAMAGEATPVQFTVDTATDELISVAHGLVEDDPVVLRSTGALPEPFVSLDRIYFVCAGPTVDRFQLCEYVSGPAIPIETTGFGTHQYGLRDYFVTTSLVDDRLITGFVDTDQFRSIEIDVSTRITGTLFLEYTEDVQGSQTLQPPITSRNLTEALAAQGGGNFVFPPRHDGFRSRYVNGPDAGSVSLFANLRATTVESPRGLLETGLHATDELLHTKAIMAGIGPSGNSKNLAAQGRHVGGSASGRSISDAGTTSGSSTITSLTADFRLSDLGRAITSDVFPPGTTLVSLVSATEAVASLPATVTDVEATVVLGTVLGSDEKFVGRWVEWQDSFLGLVTEVVADQDGLFRIDFSVEDRPREDIDTDVIDFIDVTYSAGENLVRTTPLQSRWVRVQFINGSAGQTNFSLDSAFITTSLPDVLEPFSTDPRPRNLAGLEKAALWAFDADSPTTEPLVKVRSKDGGLRTSIRAHETSTPIRPLSTHRTGRAQISSVGVATLPPVPLEDRATISFTNHATEVTVWYSEDPTKVPQQADGILPSSYKDIEIDPGTLLYFATEEGDGPAITNNVVLAADTVDSNSGVTSPANLYASDDSRAIFPAQGATCQISGFDAGALTLEVLSVKIRAEARRAATPTTEVVTYTDATTAEAGNVGSITVSAVPSDESQFYLLSVSRRDTGAAVTSVTDTMGLGPWTLVNDDGGGEARTSVYRATGTPTGSGDVTVTFSTAADHCTAVVSRYTGVDLASPVVASDTQQGNSGSYSGSVTGEANGLVVVTTGTETIGLTSVGGGGTIRVPTFGSTSNNDNRHSLSTRPAAAGLTAYSGTFSGSNDYATVATSLRPAPAADPSLEVTYTVSGTPGASSLTQTVVSTTDVTFEGDITSDRAWTYSALNNLALAITRTSAGAPNLEIDRVWVEVLEGTDTSFATVSWTEIGGILE